MFRRRLRRRIADGLGACLTGLVANCSIHLSFPISFTTAGLQSRVILRKQLMSHRVSRYPRDLRGELCLHFFLMFQERIKLVPRLVVAVSNGNICEIIRPLLSPQAGAAMPRRVYRTRLICVVGRGRTSSRV